MIVYCYERSKVLTKRIHAGKKCRARERNQWGSMWKSVDDTMGFIPLTSRVLE